VVDVDIAALTCVVDDGDCTPIYDVRLQPVIVAEQSCIIFPKIGSIAAILKLDSYPETWQLMWSSNIQSLVARADTIKLNGGNSKVIIEDAGVTIARGGIGLKELLTDIVNEVLAVYAPKNVAALQDIKLRINQLLKPV
ncbi:MAG TPA: hypothetical protein PKD90_04470, partial [Phnomibacter sp.]|nr:hypothetical protein [Phnomibacter sp.]